MILKASIPQYSFEFNESIASIWLGYSSPPRYFFVTIAATNLATFILSFLGNSLLLQFYISKERRKRGFYLVFLIIAELTHTVFALWIFGVNAINEYFVFGYFGCQYYSFVMTATSISTIHLMTVISVEKCFAVTKPFYFRRIQMKHKIGTVVTVICFSTIFAVFPLFGWGRYVPDGLLISCGFDYVSRTPNSRSHITALFLVAFFLPVSIIAISYIAIGCEARKFDHNIHTPVKLSVGRKDSPVSTTAAEAEGLHFSRTLAVVDSPGLQIKRYEKAKTRSKDRHHITDAFLAAWLPYAILALNGQYGNQKLVNPYSVTITETIAKTAVVWNPIVHTFRDKTLYRFIWKNFGMKTFQTKRGNATTPDTRDVRKSTVITNC